MNVEKNKQMNQILEHLENRKEKDELIIRIDERVANIQEHMVTKEEFEPVAKQVEENKESVDSMKIQIAKWSGIFSIAYGIIATIVSNFINK